eukprot:1160151-Pelagomonas_calceolata.AAC.5
MAYLGSPCQVLHAGLQHRIFAKLNVAYFARKYPAVQDAFLKSLLEVAVRYHKTLAGEEVGMLWVLNGRGWPEWQGLTYAQHTNITRTKC